MNVEIKGTIKSIQETQRVTDSFSKRAFRVAFKEANKYDQVVELEFQQDRCDLLDRFSEGDVVTVQANVRGREYQGKCYMTLVAWKIEVV
jgi:hypothetical protein